MAASLAFLPIDWNDIQVGMILDSNVVLEPATALLLAAGLVALALRKRTRS